MSAATAPPLIRYRDIPKYFRQKPTFAQLAQWEECNLIHPFRPSQQSRAMYYTRELAQILEGPQK